MENEEQENKIREALFKGLADEKVQAEFERYVRKHSHDFDSAAGDYAMRRTLSECFPLNPLSR